MAKKCVTCGAPLEGFFAKIASFAGVKPSAKNPDYCNKCEDKITSEISETSSTSEISKIKEPTDLFEDVDKKAEE